MKLKTEIRPNDRITIDDAGEYLVLNVQPNQFGGPDTITYQDNDEEFVVSADRCSIAKNNDEIRN